MYAWIILTWKLFHRDRHHLQYFDNHNDESNLLYILFFGENQCYIAYSVLKQCEWSRMLMFLCQVHRQQQMSIMKPIILRNFSKSRSHIVNIFCNVISSYQLVPTHLSVNLSLIHENTINVPSTTIISIPSHFF